jgi:hypothetical protein
MYLPFYATSGIFVGGVMRWIMDTLLAKSKADEEQTRKAENTGVLISSGLIAGGALTAVVIAFIVLGFNILGTPMPDDPAYQAMTAELGIKSDEVPTFLDTLRGSIGFEANPWLGLIAFIGFGLLLTWVPFRRSRG